MSVHIPASTERCESCGGHFSKQGRKPNFATRMNRGWLLVNGSDVNCYCFNCLRETLGDMVIDNEGLRLSRFEGKQAKKCVDTWYGPSIDKFNMGVFVIE